METTFSTPILAKVKQHANGILTHLAPHFVYHNLQHTQEVVSAAEEIGKASNLSSEEFEILLLSAWLHDTGYKEGNPQTHEETSQSIAEDFLTSEGLPTAKINRVKEAIAATRMPQNPKDKVSEILCDADLHHLASKDFTERSNMLRAEWRDVENKVMSEEEWIDININFLKNHSFFTAYAREYFQSGKNKNLKQLEKKKKKLLRKEEEQLAGSLGVDTERLKKMKKKLQKVEGRPERGIETMFRVTSRNHVDFSSMADSKANILISVNSIIITIIIGVLIRKLDNNPHLIIPTFLLLTVCLTSIVFAILATRPNVTSGRFTQDDIKNKKANLLFFGNFYKMKLQDFEWGMNEMINDSDYLYGSMIRDIYFIGAVLGKKYQYLRTAYTIFMIGLVVSSVAFMAASIMYPEAAVNASDGLDSLF